MISGPGHPRILTFDATSVTLRAPEPGTYRIAVHWSPYWTPSRGCLSSTGDTMLRLRTDEGGIVRLAFRVTLSSVLDTVAGRPATQCAPRPR